MNAMLKPETPKDAARRLATHAIREGFNPVALHAYHDTDNNPWCYRIRMKKSDGDKWMRPMHFDGARYVLGEPPAPDNGKPIYRPPYPLVDIDPVVIVEGETSADALAGLGITATTSGSADSAHAADWASLKGRSVLLWPDNDAAGRKYAEQVTAILHAQGCTVEVIDVAALNLPDKGDAVDWIAAHPNAAAADVLALPRLKTSKGNQTELCPRLEKQIKVNQTGNAPRIELRCASDIVCRPIRWLWPGWLARGKLHILAGAPGTGKTTIALTLAAAVTSGGRWPSGTSAPVGNVLIWSGEDDAADTIVPRLKAAGADLARVFIVGDYRAGDDARPFDPADDMDLLEAEAARIGNVVLLIADPVVSAVAGDSHKNTEVRRALQPIVDLASRLDAAVIGISHFSKGSAGKDPTERVTGSIAFGAIARVVMVTAKHTDGDADTRLLARAKSNIGPDGGGFAYALDQIEHGDVSASVVRWGASLDGSARDLLGDAEADNGVDGSARDEACQWLRDELANGPRPPKQLKAEATKAGISWRTVERAKSELAVKSEKTGYDGEWRWHLPKSIEDRQHRQELERENLGGLGGLGGLGDVGVNQAGDVEVIEL